MSPPLLLLLASLVQADRPSIAPTRLEPDTAVQVDGELDEPFWERAARLSPLTVTEPVEGAQPTWPTDVLLAYDADCLYLGLRCHDDPGQVRARQMSRDAYVRYDDVVEFWIDTFDDQRFAFWFQITAAGSRGDALLADSGSSFNKSWDGIWYGRARITEGGWQAEIALPFKTLAFGEGNETWGFNLCRKRVANGEEARWANPRVAYRFWSLAEGGALTGMTGMRQGTGVDVVPYLRGALGRDFEEGEDDVHGEGDFGLDVTWRPTPSSTLRVTTNTDFAETEVDDRRINLSRFPLFFPEKRDFFLEDAGMFEFGPSSYRGGGSSSVRPFFSRTIGRDPDGEAIPLLAGIKATGRLGDWNVGLLETRVDSYSLEGEDVDQKTLGVLRVSRNLGGENSVGGIFTHGRPDGDGDAATWGADFRLGSTRLFGDGQTGSLWGYYVASDGEGEPGGAAYGLRAEARNASWGQSLSASVTEEDYDPELGFVRRTGVEQYRYSLGYTWRGGGEDALRSVSWRVGPRYDVDRVGREDQFELPVKWLEIELQSEDSISIGSTYFRERLDEGFDMTDEVFVSQGDYSGANHVLEFEANDRRRVTGDVEIEFGDFYSGSILRVEVSPKWIPSRFFSWSLDLEDIHVDLDEGSFDTQVIATDLDFNFDPDLSLSNLLQYDTESEDLTWQSRLHWIRTAGQNLYLVGLFGWDRTDRHSFARTSQELVLKLSYTWRF